MYYLLNIALLLLGLSAVCGGGWGVLTDRFEVPVGLVVMGGGLGLVALTVALQPFLAAGRLRRVADALGGHLETHRDAVRWFRELDRLLDPEDTRDFRLQRVGGIPWAGRTGSVDLAWWWHARLQPPGTRRAIAHLDLVVRLSAACPVSAQVLPRGRGTRLAGHEPVRTGGPLDEAYTLFAPRPARATPLFDPSLQPALDATFAAIRGVLFPGAMVRLLLFHGGVAALIKNASADALAPDRIQDLLAALAPLAEAIEHRSAALGDALEPPPS